MKKWIGIVTAVFMLSSLTYAQQTSQIKKSAAFLKVSSPGTQMVDDNGQPVNTFIVERTIYLELPANQRLVVSKVRSGKFFFNAGTERLAAKKLTIGYRLADDSAIKIKASGTNRLWKVVLFPANRQQEPKVDPLQNLEVTGLINNRKFRFVIKKETLLKGDQNY